MKPSEVSLAVKTCLDARQPVCIWGDPGIGKSSLTNQISQSTNRQLRDIRVALLDPVDLRGLPDVHNGATRWNPPVFLPKDGAGIMFFDEINRGVAMVQNGLLQLVLDGRLGEYVLPADWRMMAACNYDGGGVSKMNAALASRFIHLDMQVDLDDWCKWAVANDIEPATIAFLRFRPELLHQYDPKARAFPCPRTWEFVSKITRQQPAKNVELGLYEGTVGHGAAIEYAAFLQLYRNIPSIDSILLNPEKAPVPMNDAASLWAISSALAKRASDQNLRRVIKYLDRMPGEYAAMTMRDAAARDGNLLTADGATEWIVAHPEVFA